MWIAGIIAATVPLAQTERWQNLSLQRGRKYLDLQRKNMADLHIAEAEFEDKIHLRKQALARELHLTEMSHDLGIAQREAVRDDWAQHSLYLQSLMMMASLMFSCVCAIFCEASISIGSVIDNEDSSSSVVAVAPAAADDGVSRWESGVSALLFSLFCAIGISTSMLSLWLGMKIQARMAEFDFHAPTALYKPCNKPHFEFSDYHACHLQQIEKASFRLFLVSVVCTVLSGGLTFCTTLSQTWKSTSINNNDTTSTTAGATAAGAAGDWRDDSTTIPYYVPIIIACVVVGVIVLASIVGFRNAQ